jgi:hypothetical protein
VLGEAAPGVGGNVVLVFVPTEVVLLALEVGGTLVAVVREGLTGLLEGPDELSLAGELDVAVFVRETPRGLLVAFADGVLAVSAPALKVVQASSAVVKVLSVAFELHTLGIRVLSVHK